MFLLVCYEINDVSRTTFQAVTFYHHHRTSVRGTGMISLFRIAALIASVVGVNGFFSISYKPAPNENAKMMNFGSTFVAPPNADQVADVYSRLSSRPPLLWEGIDCIIRLFWGIYKCFSQIKSTFLLLEQLVSMPTAKSIFQLFWKYMEEVSILI